MEWLRNPEFFQWVIIPLLIFCARVLDVSLDTMRIMLFSRGKKMIPPLLGFVQVLIWLFAIRQIFLNLSNWACYIGYAGGFAAGTYIGMIIEERLAIGIQVVKVITRADASALTQVLMREGYGVTSMDGYGATGKVNVLHTIVKRAEIPAILRIIKRFNPGAFYTIEDIRSVSLANAAAGREYPASVKKAGDGRLPDGPAEDAGGEAATGAHA